MADNSGILEALSQRLKDSNADYDSLHHLLHSKLNHLNCNLGNVSQSIVSQIEIFSNERLEVILTETNQYYIVITKQL